SPAWCGYRIRDAYRYSPAPPRSDRACARRSRRFARASLACGRRTSPSCRVIPAGERAGVAPSPAAAPSTAGATARLRRCGLPAARAVGEKAKKLASHVLEAAEHDLELVDGEVRVVGASQLSIKLGELARILKGAPGYGFPADIDPGLDANVNWRTDALAYA